MQHSKDTNGSEIVVDSKEKQEERAHSTCLGLSGHWGAHFVLHMYKYELYREMQHTI